MKVRKMTRALTRANKSCGDPLSAIGRPKYITKPTDFAARKTFLSFVKEPVDWLEVGLRHSG